jgi:transcriptional regulator with XRE-family HTH domain
MSTNGVDWFAARLKKLREAAGLSQYALAKATGLSKQAVNKLEAGGREPSWGTIQLLAKALSVTCEAFNDPGLSLPAPAAPKPKGRPRKAAPEPAKGRSAGKASEDTTAPKRAPRGKRKGKGE